MNSQTTNQDSTPESIRLDLQLQHQRWNRPRMDVRSNTINLIVNFIFRKCCAAFIILCFITQASSPTIQAATPKIESRVESILSRMTLEEKIDMLGGVDGFFIRGLARLGLPRLKMADGPIGVRNDGPATVMAAGIALAATWDSDLAQRVGREIGRDARAKGVHFLLGPGVNIYRA